MDVVKCKISGFVKYLDFAKYFAVMVIGHQITIVSLINWTNLRFDTFFKFTLAKVLLASSKMFEWKSGFLKYLDFAKYECLSEDFMFFCHISYLPLGCQS